MTVKSLRPPEGFNIIFPELVEDISEEEFVRWRNEINLIWDGYDVEWIKLGERVWGIKCKRKAEGDGHGEETKKGEFGFGPH